MNDRYLFRAKRIDNGAILEEKGGEWYETGREGSEDAGAVLE